jgi:hypothetical protein
MRELHNLIAFPIDNLDKTGACGQHHFYGIRLQQSFVKRRGRRRFELNCKNRQELLDAKRANRHQEAL